MLRIRKQKDETLQEKEEICPLGKRKKERRNKQSKGRKMLRIRKQKDETLQEKEKICPLGKERKKERI